MFCELLCHLRDRVTHQAHKARKPTEVGIMPKGRNLYVKRTHMKNEDKDKKPLENSPEGEADAKKKPVEGNEDASDDDADFEEELKALESNGEGSQESKKPQRTELEKATFTAKSTLKRIKELGGDPNEVLEEEGIVRKPADRSADIDTSNFVTKTDLAEQEARKLTKTPGEFKLVMWWVKNKGMSVTDAHYMANKGKILRSVGEISRGRSVVPADAGGGAGGAQRLDKDDAPDLPELDKRRVASAGMVYDASKKAYVGKKVQLRWDGASKTWVSEAVKK